MHYREWLENKKLLEALEGEAIEAFQPKDAKWVPPLSTGGNGYFRYFFNVPGDPCQEHNGNPCYSVNVGGDDAGVAFYRKGSTEDARVGQPSVVFMSILKGLGEFLKEKKPKSFTWGAVGKTNVDTRGEKDLLFADVKITQVGPESQHKVDDTVKVYVNNKLTKKSAAISPVGVSGDADLQSLVRSSENNPQQIGIGDTVELEDKSIGRVLSFHSKKTLKKVAGFSGNVEARKSVYEKLAIRNIFPSYIPINAEKWIRKDKYDEDYAKQGYPAIPDEVMEKAARGELSAGAKFKIVLGMRRNNLKKDDKIILFSHSRVPVEGWGLTGKIVDFDEDDNAIIKPDEEWVGIARDHWRLSTDGNIEVPPKHLKVDTPENRAEIQAKKVEEQERTRRQEEERRQREEQMLREREAALNLALQDPQKNPNGIQVGDTVDLSGADVDGTGEVTSFQLSAYRELYAKVRIIDLDQSEHARRTGYITVGQTASYLTNQLHKETEERKNVRVGGVRGREEQHRRANEERVARALADPYENPNNLKKDDRVIYLSNDRRASGELSYLGFTGQIVDFKKPNYDSLYALVRVDEEWQTIASNSFGEGNASILPKYLKIDTPENRAEVERMKAEIVERRRREEERIRQQEEERRRQQEEELSQAVQNPQINPYGIQVGDRIVHYSDLPNSINNYENLPTPKGTVRGFSLEYGTLYATVEYDEEFQGSWGGSTHLLSPRTLLKDTPDVQQRAEEVVRQRQAEVERQRREREGEQLRSREQRRSTRVAGQAASEQRIRDRAAATTEFAQDRVANPNGFKVGDQVEITSGRDMGRFGEIIDLRRSIYYNHIIQALVKRRGSSGIENWYDVGRIRLDTSVRATVGVARRQRAVQRHQALQTTLQGANPSNFQVGENVTVTSGQNRGRVGNILRFATGTQGNVRATIVDSENATFTASLNNLRRNQAAA